MWDPLFPDEPAVRPGHRGQGVALVGIERDILHVLRLLSWLTPPSVADAHGNLTVGGGAALSSHQRDSHPCFSLERVVTRTATTRTYAPVATGGCHAVLKPEG
jgi:hypothetical protein